MGDIGAEALFDAGNGILGVLNGVVENGGGQRSGIQAHVRENVGDFEQVGQVRLAGAAKLVVVALGGNLVGAPDHPGIFGGAVLSKFFEQFFKARVELASRAVAVEAER